MSPRLLPPCAAWQASFRGGVGLSLVVLAPAVKVGGALRRPRAVVIVVVIIDANVVALSSLVALRVTMPKAVGTIAVATAGAATTAAGYGWRRSGSDSAFSLPQRECRRP